MADLDTLFLLADKAPLFDRVESALRGEGNHKLADAIVKLQQDAGLELDNEMTGSFDEPAPGPQTALLRAAYEPVTLVRLSLLNDAFAVVREQDIREDLCEVLRKLPKPAAPTPGNAPRPA
ncbi:MAG TPA: hypothetical protein VEF76_10235 [Patescibacteria group bacterium]|nr:hypothetical protein [Patescibacteria group bacterium]